MQPIEIALFGAMIALATGLIGYILWPIARRRGGARGGAGKRGGAASQPHPVGGPGGRTAVVVCPACQREYDAGLQFCPHDARELVPASDPAARAAAPGMTCP